MLQVTRSCSHDSQASPTPLLMSVAGCLAAITTALVSSAVHVDGSVVPECVVENGRVR